MGTYIIAVIKTLNLNSLYDFLDKQRTNLYHITGK